MKKNISSLLMVLTLFCIGANAQDIIMFRNGDEIKAKLIDISEDEVMYKNFSNLNGPAIIKNKSEIFLVKKEDGTKIFMKTKKVEEVKTEAKVTSVVATVVPSVPVITNTPIAALPITPKPADVPIQNNISKSKDDILTNETVVMLYKKGLGSSIIINKIKTAKTRFDISTDALIKLKDDHVPDDIVATMVEYAANTDNAVIDYNDPLAMHNSGIYYFNPNDNEKRLVRIDPTVVSSNKSGGFGTALAQQYTYGLANNNSVSNVSGSNSRRQIRDARPTFYFYFEKVKGQLNTTSNWWFAAASSPNEFALVKLKEKKDHREMVIGKSNAYGSSLGIEEKLKVQFDIDEVAPNIFKVVLRGIINPGEYCFIFTGSTPSVHTNDKVFDFGIF